MTAPDPKTTARRALEALDRRDTAALRELFAPSVRIHIAGQELDLASWLGMGEMFYGAFPDGAHEVTGVVAEGDRVVVRCMWHGTHRAAFQGIPATGKRVSLTTFIEQRIVDGRIVEYRGLFDAMGMMQQLGVMPSA